MTIYQDGATKWARKQSLIERNRRARKWFQVRKFVSDNLDAVLTAGAERLKICHTTHNAGWLFAQMWFTDCPCCLFYRGAVFGAAAFGILVALVTGLVTLF